MNPEEPTAQQEDLANSLPHQDWLNIDRKSYDYYIRRSYVSPFEAHQPEIEPGEERPYRSISAVLRRNWNLAGEYKAQGYNVLRDIKNGVHRIIKAGEPPFYLFPEYVSRREIGHSLPTAHGIMQKNGSASPQVVYDILTVRVERRTLKILKALAERNDQPVSELLEEIIASAVHGGSAFDPDTMGHIRQLKLLYGLQSPADENIP